MGRQATRREMSYLETGVEVFYMEILGKVVNKSNLEAAVTAAIEAAVATAQRAITRGTRDDILEKAVDIDTDEENDLNEDGVASLVWYAKLLDEMLPPEQRLEPVSEL